MIKYKELKLGDLKEYDKIPFCYTTNKKYELRKINRGLNGFELKLVDVPLHTKTFDTKTSKWINYFEDLSNWKIYIAEDNDNLIGGIVIATKTPECDMLEDRNDLAVLWDIRVREEYKNRGIGQKLFNLAIEFCRENNFKQLKIECQNTNPVAINFYYKQGATLCAINEYAYKENKEEIQLLWYIDL